MRRGTIGLSVLALTLLGSVAGSTASAQEATPTSSLAGKGYHELTVTVTDTAYQAPAEVSSGLTLVTLVNQTDQEQSADFFTPPAGETMDEMLQAVATPVADDGFPSFLYDATLTGGPLARSGGSGQALVNLTPGDWAIAGEGDQQPTFIKVTQDAGPAIAEPTSDIDVQLQEFAFVGLPEQMTAGDHLLKLTNTGDQPHLLYIATAPDGITMQQLMELMAMPDDATPPADVPYAEADFQTVGGLEILSSGQTAWLPLDLKPGTYFVACFVPDRETGVPHAMMGMAQLITVS
jgi:hypothetical protein